MPFSGEQQTRIEKWFRETVLPRPCPFCQQVGRLRYHPEMLGLVHTTGGELKMPGTVPMAGMIGVTCDSCGHSMLFSQNTVLG